jgi:hypothetical protein
MFGKKKTDDPSWLPAILDKRVDQMTEKDIWNVFHHAWGRAKDKVYDKRLWNILDSVMHRLTVARPVRTDEVVHGVVQAMSVVEKGLDEFARCSYWSAEDKEEIFECRSECHHRRTCEALYGFKGLMERKS